MPKLEVNEIERWEDNKTSADPLSSLDLQKPTDVHVDNTSNRSHQQGSIGTTSQGWWVQKVEVQILAQKIFEFGPSETSESFNLTPFHEPILRSF